MASDFHSAHGRDATPRMSLSVMSASPADGYVVPACDGDGLAEHARVDLGVTGAPDRDLDRRRHHVAVPAHERDVAMRPARSSVVARGDGTP